MTSKNFHQPPDYSTLLDRWANSYDDMHYKKSLSAAVLTQTHVLIERPFGPDVFLSQVLEVGAGTLAHLPFVRHRFDRYIASDNHQGVLDASVHKLLPPRVERLKLEGITLPFEDDTFDRLIATHVLEHIPLPHLALQEWVRVLKPGGVLSLLLPCDPGLAWRLGRYFGPRQEAKKVGLPYDYFMAREHVNSIFNLHQILEYHFPNRKVTWWPLRVPFPDVNLIYAGNFYV